MAVVFQLLMAAATAAGSGYWLWLVAGHRSRRSLDWMWFGLAGYACHVLLLQALVYFDLPVHATAPWLLVISLVGVGALLRRAWRQHRTALRLGEAGLLLAAAALAMGVQGRSLVAIGADHFVGYPTIDQVNYVMTAQALADVPLPGSVSQIGLRPWLYRPVLARHERLTECVALADQAVVAGTDGQRAWGPSALWFIALLAIAVAGMIRSLSPVPLAVAAAGGVWAAVLPAVATVYLSGFYSQLSTLWTFPALIAICRPGAFAGRARILLAAATLGFLFGGYTEFAPFGAAIVGLLVFASGGGLGRRVGILAAILALAAVSTTGYLGDALRFLLAQIGHATNPGLLTVWAQGAGTWAGWAQGLFAPGPAGRIAAGVVLGGLVLAGTLPAPVRRQWWWAALAAPLAAFVALGVQRHVPVYALYKLGLGFAPVCVGAATVGIWSLARRTRRAAAWIGAGALAAGIAGSASGAAALHRTLLDTVLHRQAVDFGRLWAARDRAAAEPGSLFLIHAGNSYTGAWLCYFARHSRAYYDGDAISDRRAPTSQLAFRNVPPNARCTWLALNRTGTVKGYEPTPRLTFVDPVRSMGSTLELGADTEIRVTRVRGAGPPVRTWALECGIVPLPGVGPCRLDLCDASGRRCESMTIAGPQLIHLPLAAKPGDNVFSLRIAGAARPAAATAPLVLVNSVSLERGGAESSALGGR